MSRSIIVSVSIIVAAMAVVPSGCKSAAAPVALPIPEVAVTDVVQKNVPIFSESVGTTEGFVNADIYPKITGYLLKQNYRDGDQVHAGQLLFQIDDREYKAALDQALGDLGQKQADYKKNRQDLDKYTPLYEQQVISKQEFDHVTQTTRASAAAVAAAEAAVETAKLNEQWTQVTSPVDGVAGIAKTQVGDLVSPTTLLATVSQLDPIKVEFPISEQQYLHFADRINQDPQARANNGPKFEMILSDGSTYKYTGHIYDVNRQVNIQTGTIEVQATFPNPGNILRPGLYAKIRAATGTVHNALLVPQEHCARNPRAIPSRRRGLGQQGDDAHRRGRPAGRWSSNHREGSLTWRTRHHRGTAEGLRRDGSEAAVGASGAFPRRISDVNRPGAFGRRDARRPELVRCRGSSSTGPSSRWL